MIRLSIDDADGVMERDLFIRVIQNELVNKPVLCKFAQELLNDLPDWFWLESASSSGKYHPLHDLGEGGLARHSLMVYRWLKSLLEANPQDLSFYLPGMVVAALFHDSCKRGLPSQPMSEHTLHEHPILAAKWILDKSEKFLKDNKEFIENTADDEDSFKQDVAIVISCIETHMGKWNKGKNEEDVVLPTPKDTIQYLVHIADYIASRKCTTFDADFFLKLFCESN